MFQYAKQSCAYVLTPYLKPDTIKLLIADWLRYIGARSIDAAFIGHIGKKQIRVSIEDNDLYSSRYYMFMTVNLLCNAMS